MNLRSLRLQPLRIRFRVAVRHASAERRVTQSVLVVAETDGAVRGLGEGCPREYVTGEDVASATGFFDRWRAELTAAIHSLADLRAWVEAHEDDIDRHPAAWCAVELALLDALARERGCSVEALLELPELAGSYPYTAVLGDADLDTARQHVGRYAALGFRDFKIKIRGDAASDSERMQLVRRAVPDARLRLDGNNLWHDAAHVVGYLGRLEPQPWALEEPLQPRDDDGLRRLVAAVDGLSIVLDESFLRRQDLARIPEPAERFVVNLRVSKMGGLLRSLRVARQAVADGRPLILGAQVGETSLLTRAALAVGQALGEGVVAREGAFGTLLLERDVVERPLAFGAGGCLVPAPLLSAGAGGWQLDYKLEGLLEP